MELSSVRRAGRSGGFLQPDLVRYRQRSIVALLEFDGREEKLRVAYVLDTVQEILSRPIMHVLRIARKMIDVDDAAVLEIAPCRTVSMAGPKIVENMPVKVASLARG
jgi:hypothetical protein